MSRPEFYSHNIILPDGTETAPGLARVAECAPLKVALRELTEEAGFASAREIEDWREFVPPYQHIPGGAGAWGDRCVFLAVK